MRSFLLVILLAGVANSQQQPTSSSIMDFSGGLNTLAAPIYLPPSESPDLMNVVIDEPLGALVQRNGYVLCGRVPSGNTATNLYEYNKSDGSRNLMVTDNITIWQTADCVNFTTAVTGLNSLFIPRFETVQDKLWVVNGSTWVFTWDGTSVSYLDGTGGKPSPPKGRYIKNWKNRVWIASPSTDPSAVSFNRLTSSTGAIIAPDISSQAWSTLNTIYFGKDDGSPIYGIYPYKDNLLVFKEAAIWRLLWDSEFNLNVVKSVSTIGSKFNDSIAEMDDGVLRYVGRDGIYKYDGQVPQRVSTKITPNFYQIKQPNMGERTGNWSSSADFLRGSLTNVSTSYAAGSLALSYYGSGVTLFDDFRYNNYTTKPTWALGSHTADFTVPGKLVYQQPPGTYAYLSTYIPALSPYGEYSEDVVISGRALSDSLYSVAVYSWDIFNTQASGGGNGYRVGFELIGTDTFNRPIWTLNLWRMVAGSASLIDSTNCTVSGSAPASMTGNLKVSRTGAGVFTVSYNACTTITATDTTYAPSSGYMTHYVGTVGTTDVSPRPLVSIDNIYVPLYFQPSGYHTTEVSTATGLSKWSIFDAQSTDNGQTITYEIKTASTIGNLATTAWRSITPGATISSSTVDIYAQVRSSMSTTNSGVTPLLNSISLTWITGDITISPIKGLVYKSRYWLAGSTQPANLYNDTTLIESRPPLGSYTLFNLPLSAMTLWNNNLYGAVSNTDKIVRLDYGTDDGGTAITSWWTSKDEVYQNPIRYKNINKAILDYLGINGSLSISLSPNEGSTSQSRTMDITTGPRSTKILNFDANQSQAFRVKILNNTLGSTYKIYGVHTLGNVTDFIGN